MRVEPIENILERRGHDVAMVASRHLDVFDLDTELLTHFNHYPRTLHRNGGILVAMDYNLGM